MPDENGNTLFNKVLKTSSNMATEDDGTVLSNPTRCFFIIDGSNYGVALNNYNQYTAQELVDCSKKSYINVVFERTVMDGNGSPKYYHTKAESISTNVYRYYFGDQLAPIIVDGDNNTFTLDPDWVAPTQNVKSVNNILPDENGNVELETATDDDILALMMEVDALPVVMDESGAIMTDEEGAILLA